jgi:hypothetical protein
MTRIDHTGHDHSNTTAARTACRKMTGGVRVADMIQDSRGQWGVVVNIYYGTGELQTKFGDTVTLWVPASEVHAVERRTRS